MDEQRISRTGQIKVYFGKCLRLFVNEKQWSCFISTVIIMAIISMVTGDEMFESYGPTKSGVFAIVSACIWIGLFNSIRSICKERAIIKREHRSGLHISSYILAHVGYEAVLCLGETLIVLLIMLIKNHAHLPDSGLVFPLFVDLFLSFFLVMFAADMLALLVSCVVKDENMAMTVMPFVLIVQLVMSGSVFELTGLTNLISYITVSHWGMNAVLSIACTDFVVRQQANWYEAEGVSASAGNVLMIWLVLLFFILLYIALAVLFLKQVDRDQR